MRESKFKRVRTHVLVHGDTAAPSLMRLSQILICKNHDSKNSLDVPRVLDELKKVADAMTQIFLELSKILRWLSLDPDFGPSSLTIFENSCLRPLDAKSIQNFDFGSFGSFGRFVVKVDLLFG